MKQILMILAFFGVYFLAIDDLKADEKDSSHLRQIYLCARLNEAAKEWNTVITHVLDQKFRLFRPQDIDLSHLSQLELDAAAYHADFEGMKQSDLLLVLTPYGRDCAWEIGWFCGVQKPAIAYAEEGGEWLRDAMVKGGLTAIITNNSNLYQALLKDPSTKDKSYWIPSRNQLADSIQFINEQNTSLSKP